MKKLKTLAAGILMVPIFIGQVSAMNIDGSTSAASEAGGSGEGSGQVEVTNLPIQMVKKKIDGEEKEIPYLKVTGGDYFIQEVGKDISLGNGETFESESFDVREYKEVSFYVVPDQILGGSSDAVYQLDAFFSITPEAQKIQKMGEKSGGNSNGWQEFGNMSVDEKSKEQQSSFQKLSTGVTSTRVLTTKVYGPFIHVVLKNLTPDSKQRFKIVAYLSR